MNKIFTHPWLVRHWPYLALAVAILATYAGVYDNAFLYDDPYLITNNAFLKSWDRFGDLITSTNIAGAGGGGAFYRPLPGILHLIIWQLFGASTTAYHALNIVLHIASSCVLFTLARRLGFVLIASFIGTLVWALHPMQVESVTYMSGTADLLFSLFCLLGVMVLLPDLSPRRMLLAIVCMVAGLLSKETAVIMPALAVCAVFCINARRWSPATYLETWPLWLTAFLFFLLRSTVLSFGGIANITTAHEYYTNNTYVRIYTFLSSLTEYLHIIFWPQNLHLDRYPPIYGMLWKPVVFYGLIIVAMLVVTACWRPRQAKASSAAFGALWFMVAMFPNSGIAIPLNAFIFEHWLYLPTAGLFIGFIAALPQRKHVLYGGLCIAAVLSVATWRQNETWKEPMSFYTRLHELEPGNGRIQNNLAQAYYNIGDYATSEQHLRQLIAYCPPFADAEANLAVVILVQRRTPEALRDALHHVQQSLLADPQNSKAHELLAAITQWLREHPDDVPAEYKK